MAHSIVVVGGSAGALDPLRKMVSRLPATLRRDGPRRGPHLPDTTSVMPDLLARYTPLPIAFAVGGEPVFLGRTPVAPANHHLLLTDGRVAVTRGPRENGFRPALDPLFRTAARWYGARASASSSPADSTTGRAASRA